MIVCGHRARFYILNSKGMMIVGLGLDLVDVRKLASSLKRESFRGKVFTPAEIAACSRLKNPAECYAGKFAAKEAFLKAIGSGLRQGIWFSQIQVLGKASGEPSIKVTGEAQRILQSLGSISVHVSISHTSGFAAAVVVLEKGHEA
jgi:holo-[acyl-carrier protein] synthase